MHYIRFLKLPSLNRQVKDAKALQLIAKITIASDLGESFLCVDLPLLAILLDNARNRVQVHSYQWKAGSRQLEISFPIAVGLAWPIRLLVQPEHSSHGPDSFARILMSSIILGLPAGGVLPILSYGFWGTAQANSSRRVQRRAYMADGGELCVWEDTDESIARHIWDAGLLLAALLDSYGQDAKQDSRIPRLHIQKVLLRENLEVLELGAGCGIVGITVARRFLNAKVLLTDLPEAEDLARYNIAAQYNNCAKIDYQNLDWAKPLPKNLCTGSLGLVLVADCTYNPDVVPDLVNTLAEVVKHNPDVMILLAMKVRHESEMVFFNLMKKQHMMLIDKLVLPLPLLGQEAEEIEVYVFKGN